jgi:hypothetical protein
LIRQQLWARLTATTVEIFRGGKRVACHRRAIPGDTGATTLNDHMPASHRRYAEVSPQMLRERAVRIGPATAILVDIILRDRPHPSRASAPASASCGWHAATVRSGSRPPATGRWQSTRAP